MVARRVSGGPLRSMGAACNRSRRRPRGALYRAWPHADSGLGKRSPTTSSLLSSPSASALTP